MIGHHAPQSPPRTPVCDLLGIDVPVVQAPIGSAATSELAAAVSGAGGLGTLALTWVPVQEARRQIARTRQLTDHPFAVNLVLDFPIATLLDACLDDGVRIISTFWGDPAPVTERTHAAGAVHIHTVGTVAEAVAAAEAGVDVVVAQGWEAGGHVRGQVSTLALVPGVVDAVGEVPVIAAGGIGDGRGLAAVLMLGAQAGWIGTRFLTAPEANAHPDYRAAVLRAQATDTVYSGCFDGGWPNAPHRALRNTTVTTWQQHGSPSSPDRPGEGDIVATTGDGRRLLRYADAIPTADAVGDIEALARYAGQSVGVCAESAPAASIVETIAAEAARRLRG